MEIQQRIVDRRSAGERFGASPAECSIIYAKGMPVRGLELAPRKHLMLKHLRTVNRRAFPYLDSCELSFWQLARSTIFLGAGTHIANPSAEPFGVIQPG